jgi:formate dehydrogenase maturation protein FdhE
MDLLELLRFQAKRYRCSACGENMADCGINVLAQQGNRALVRVTCASCNDENLLQIIFQTEAEEEKVPTIDEGLPQVADPISSDELLDLHAVLAGHEGPLTELFSRR